MSSSTREQPVGAHDAETFQVHIDIGIEYLQYTSLTDAGGPSSLSRTSRDYNRLPEVLYVFEHKTKHISTHAPYIRIVVLMIPHSSKDFVKSKLL